MEPENLTSFIRVTARDLGFDAIGIAPVSSVPEDRLKTWLERGFHGKMAYMERNFEKRLNPAMVQESAKSVISVGLNYYHSYQQPYDNPGKGVISRYASGEDYHFVLKDRLQALLDKIQQFSPDATGKVYVDTGPVLDKLWSAQSGLGWLGKHTNLLSRQQGSWFFIGEIIIDQELIYDVPTQDFCGSCSRCIEACPTDAIVEPYVLDSRRCISYLTIELRDDIPLELRSKMGNLVYGCDICQDVCPWNREVPTSQVEEFQPREGNRSPDLKELARIHPDDFSNRFRRSPLKRAKWRGLMRNVAVAMGNSGLPEMVPELVGLLNCSEPLVRRHAAWALGQIASPRALSALRSRLDKERDQETFQSITSQLPPCESTRLPQIG